MGWEQPPVGRPYYTRSMRVRGRVVREYVGGGEIGEMAARQDAERRAESEAQARARKAMNKQLAALDAAVEGAGALVKEATTATLQAAGFYQHDRGEWRRRRGKE